MSGGSTALQPGASVFRLSTSDYAPQDRLAAWCEIYGRTMCQQDIEPTDTEMIEADVVFRRFPGLGTMTGHRSPAIYRRSRAQLDSDNLFVTIALCGSFEAAQLGRTASMATADAFVGTGAEPVIACVSPGYRSVTLSVPARSIAPFVARPDTLFRRSIPAGNPALRLMTRYLGATEELDSVSSQELQQNAVAHVHDLLALALGATRDAAETARLRGAQAARLREIKADIEQNLGREDFSIVTLSARHRLPVRSVQRLFEADGMTFTDYVLERRLVRAHRLLIDPRLAERPIGIIALEAGFTNQPHFNRSFRSRFGATPSDVRSNARRHS
jgi:AraC-like DNA-binding protein